MGVALLERRAQCDGMGAPSRDFAECSMAAGICKEGKGLVVEIEAGVKDLTVKVDDRCDACVGGDEMLAEIVKRMECGFAPGAIPSESSGSAVRKRHSRDRSGAARTRKPRALEIDRLVEPTAAAIGAPLPPQRQGVMEEPPSERLRVGINIVHPAAASGW